MRVHDRRVLVDLWVVPGASRTRLMGHRGDAITLCVAAPAERGRANAAALAYLTDLLRPGLVELVAGATGRAKSVSVTGLDPDLVRARLAG